MDGDELAAGKLRSPCGQPRKNLHLSSGGRMNKDSSRHLARLQST